MSGFCRLVSKSGNALMAMRRKRLYCALVFFLTATPLFAQLGAGVAVTTKVKGDARIKRAGTTEYRPEVRRGTALRSEDWLKTLKDGYIAIIFIDDKSQMKIRENSEVEIRTERMPGALSKTVSMNFGKLKVEVAPQTRGTFTIATPTSVASVKGTEFWIISGDEGDQFIVTDGELEITNNESGESFTVGEGQTGTSNPDGTTGVEDTPEGGVPEEEEEDMNELRIELENEQTGEKKTIIIRY